MAELAQRIEARRGVVGYRDDYAAWVEHQLGLLRQRRFDELDVENLIDEVEDLGKSEFRAFVSAIEIVIVHMLRWDYQPERRGDSWRESIAEHRKRIEFEIADSPSYRGRIDEAMERAFGTARPKAARQMRRPARLMPKSNPYDWTAITMREHPLPGDDA